MLFFNHRFDPPSGSLIGPRVELTSREVEVAGLLEVLQTPGASFGNWSFLDALLDSTSDEFLFREPLGVSREVKTALSGLLGRFVARAYASRHLGFSYFAHIHGNWMPLARAGGAVRQLISGDRPDWAVWEFQQGLAIIEAKGSQTQGAHS